MATPAKARKATKKKAITKQHKDAMAVGRTQGAAVRRYLEALEENKPKRGRKRSPEAMKKRLAQVDEELKAASGLDRVHLTQERINLERHLAAASATVDLSALEKEFIASAAEYGRRKGLSYAAWRASGVSAEVLAKAGISRRS